MGWKTAIYSAEAITAVLATNSLTGCNHSSQTIMDCTVNGVVVATIALASTALGALGLGFYCAFTSTSKPSTADDQAATKATAGWPWAIAVACLVATSALALVVISLKGCGTGTSFVNERAANIAAVTLVGTVLGGLLLGFFCAFTSELTPGTIANQTEIQPMVRFSYAFVVVCLLSLFAPVATARLPEWLYESMLRSPMSLVKGCVHTKGADSELACDPNDLQKFQWFVSIGGSARRGDIATCCWRQCAPIVKDEGDAEKPHAPTSRVGEQSTRGGDATPTPLTPSATPYVPTSTPARVCAPSPPPLTTVHGGLAVPWYVITLAIMGATIGLARKIPEYQRRAIDPGDALDAQHLREYLEFQLIQVLCAPLIALVAYNLNNGNTPQGSIFLGFASGFSSEPILLAIRATVDRLTAIQPNKQPAAVPSIETVVAAAREAATTATGKPADPGAPTRTPEPTLPLPQTVQFAGAFTAALNRRLSDLKVHWKGDFGALKDKEDWKEIAATILASVTPVPPTKDDK